MSPLASEGALGDGEDSDDEDDSLAHTNMTRPVTTDRIHRRRKNHDAALAAARRSARLEHWSLFQFLRIFLITC